MTIKQLIQDIAEYAVKNEVVECAMGGLSLYEVNFKDNNNYPMLFISPSQNHNISNNTVTYNIMLYYIDRLLRDNENNIDIVNASVGKLQQIINIIKSFDDVLKVDDNYNITNFADTQRLTDNVAGGFVTLSITVQNMQGVCAIDAILPTINVIKINYQNKDINITENGDYNVTYDNGYNALKEVNVNVNIDTDSFYQEGFNTGKIEGYNEGYSEGDINGREQQKSLLEAIKITENGNYTNENGYDEVTVEIDTQSFYDNGYNTGYNEGADAGYNNGYNEGYNNGEVNGIEQGKEEQKSLLTSINITENGNYTNENGYNEVIVNVGGIPKPKLPNGISLQNSIFSTIDMSNWDWSNVYDWSEMFWNCTNLAEIQNFPSNIEIYGAKGMFYNTNLNSIPELDTSKCVTMENMFSAIDYLTTIPMLNTSNVINMDNMFNGCGDLTEIPMLDTSNVLTMNGTFSYCYNLISIPQIDTSKCTNMNNMFRDCRNLTSIPELNTSKCTTMKSMFSDCNKITTIPMLDTSNVTDMSNMFDSTDNLTTIPMLDTSNVIYMSSMFNYCRSLTTIPELDTSNVAYMDSMFYECRSLTTIPELDTSNVAYMDSMFSYCTKLTTVNMIDLSSVTDMDNMFYSCISLEEVKFKGNPKNLKNRSGIWNNAGQNIENPKMYYPQEYADSYQQIINALPSKWTAIPY